MSFISARQLTTLQIAHRQVQQASNGVFDEGQWRMTLRNVGKVKPDAAGRVSAKRLDQRGFELMMSYLERHGFQDSRSADHWRTRPGVGTGKATTRQVHEIHELAAGGRYPLAGMIQRITGKPASDARELTSDEAGKLIEALKAISQRVRKEVDHADLTTPASAQN